MFGEMSCVNTTRDVSQAGDFVTGTILLLCIAVGIPANLVALFYFYTNKLSKSNAIFFNKVYIVITFVDLLICAAWVPVTQVGFYAYTCTVSDLIQCFIYEKVTTLFY